MTSRFRWAALAAIALTILGCEAPLEDSGEAVADLRLDGDESDSLGLFVVQKWPGFGVDFYAGLRRYEVVRSDIDLEPLLVVPVGIVLNF